jgi:hypothetical protein
VQEQLQKLKVPQQQKQHQQQLLKVVVAAQTHQKPV